MNESLPPLPSDVQALLHAAEPPVPSAAFEQKVLARVRDTVATGAWPAAPATSAMGRWGTKVALASLLLGASGGTWLGYRLAARETPPTPLASVAPVAVTAAPPAPVPPSVMGGPPAIEDVPDEATPPRRLRRPPRVEVSASPTVVMGPAQTLERVRPNADPPAARDVALSDERGILEIARTALARRDYDAALRELGRHEERHPHGQLVEERESLRIQTLVSANRADEARARAAAFRQQFPRSMLLPAVDAALASVAK